MPTRIKDIPNFSTARNLSLFSLFIITSCVPALPLIKDDPLLAPPEKYPELASLNPYDLESQPSSAAPDSTPDSVAPPAAIPSSIAPDSTPSSVAPSSVPNVLTQDRSPSSLASSSAPSSAAPSTAMTLWKDFFPDTHLASLIESALKGNQELRVLEQEIAIANNEVFARQGEYIPKLGFKAGYSFDKVGQYSSQGASDFANGVPTYLQAGAIGLTTSWETDIWGKLRSASKAAYYSYLSSIEGRKYMVTRLVAEIANVYYELLALENQLNLVKSYVEVMQEIKSMVEIQQAAGRVTSLPVKRFEAEVYKNESRKLQLEQQIIMTQNRINTLVGRFPQQLERDSEQFLSLEMTKVDAGVPSQLIENRPDLKAAAFELESAKLSVQSTRAQFFPALNIEGGVGFQSFNAAHFLDFPASFLYGLAGNITAPLLNRQAIKASYFTANNKQIQAVYRYEQTLVNAYTEVINQLNMIKNMNQAYELKVKQVATLKESIEISNMLFQAARVDYIEALITQRDTLEAQEELIEIKKQQLSSYVNLYKALGGGWKTKEESKPN